MNCTSIFEAILLGLIQGLLEWLPVSSEGLSMLYMITILKLDPSSAFLIAILLHASSATAAFVWFRREFISALRVLPSIDKILMGNADDGAKVILLALVLTPLASGMVALPLFFLARSFLSDISGYAITIIIGLFLIITGVILALPKTKFPLKMLKEVSKFDLLITGLAQGLAVFPGISRSALTVSTLLWRKVGKETSLKLSFIISVPIIIGAVMVALLEAFAATGLRSIHVVGLLEIYISLMASFSTSILTMETLLRFAKKINFSIFLVAFGLLIVVANLSLILHL